VKAVKISTTTATSKKRMAKLVMIGSRGDGYLLGKQDRRHGAPGGPTA
jgi:hypothetical protein